MKGPPNGYWTIGKPRKTTNDKKNKSYWNIPTYQMWKEDCKR